MKITTIVISLVLINLLLLGWNASKATPKPSASTQTETTVQQSSVPSITLLSETSLISRAPQPEESSCYTMGPLTSVNELRQTRDQLSGYTVVMYDRQSTAQVDKGFWVYLPAFDSRTQAITAANELSSMGVRDYFVVTSGDNNNTLSLGLFSGRANAEERQQEIRALGYDARLAVRRDNEPRYWVDFRLKEDVEAPWSYIVNSSSTARHLALNCAAIDSEPMLADQTDTGPAREVLAESVVPEAVEDGGEIAQDP